MCIFPYSFVRKYQFYVRQTTIENTSTQAGTAGTKLNSPWAGFPKTPRLIYSVSCQYPHSDLNCDITLRLAKHLKSK